VQGVRIYRRMNKIIRRAEETVEQETNKGQG
jgi:hypothetical protein